MALLSAAGGNACLSGGLAAVMLYVSAHTATPGTTGANEVAGGTYARVAVSWGTPSGGSMSNSGSLSINQPAATTITHLGTWNAATVGTYEAGAPLGSSVTTGGTAGTLLIASGALAFGAS